eukprot:scaffold7935_cov382-Pinguiococcus_pyrenoidosus.AAC.1
MAKVIVVGPPQSGKTALVRRIVHHSFRGRQGNDPGPVAEAWGVPGGSGLELLFHELDKSSVYATAHHLFLQIRTIFLVVWNPKADRDDSRGLLRVHAAIRSVLDRAPEAKILLVTTHRDAGAHEMSEPGLESLWS